jgi:DNA-binding SARP family transcriptional activator
MDLPAEGAAAPPESLSLSVRLLGEPRVERLSGTARVEVEWTLRRSLKVLAYLAVADDHRVSRDALAESIWPDFGADEVERNLHPTVSLVRAALGGPKRSRGGIVLSRQGQYRLDPAVDWRIDVERFRREVAAARDAASGGRVRAILEHGRAAWSEYGGSFLAGSHDPWVAETREELHRQYLRVLSLLGEAATTLGELELAEDALRSRLLEDPLEEAVSIGLMEVYARRGRPDLVQRQFERMRSALQHELGVEPSRVAQRAFDRLLA